LYRRRRRRRRRSKLRRKRLLHKLIFTTVRIKVMRRNTVR
jgi:hypothetical protein